MRTRVGLVLLALVVIAAACNSGTPGGARSLLPDLSSMPNLQVIEGQTITEFISTLAEGQALLAANPLLAGAIQFAEGAIKCYQDLGAVAVRIYSDKNFPLASGMVAIVDKTAVADPANFVTCLTGGSGLIGPQTAIQICLHSYELKKDDHEYQIAYLGTTDDICNALCNSLEGCLDSRQ